MADKQIDYEHSVIQRVLPNGDIVNIRPQEYVERSLAALPKLATERPGVDGAMSCPHCGVGYLSSNALREHIRIDHAIASGQAEVQEIALPDGTLVPLELVMKEWLEQKAADTQRTAASRATAAGKEVAKGK